MERWPALLTLSEAANYLGVGEDLVKRLRAREAIKSVRIGERGIRFRRDDLDKFIAELPEGMGEFPKSKKE